MHILAAQRSLKWQPNLPRRHELKKNDSSRTLETSVDESSSTWDAAEKASSTESEKCDDKLTEMINTISREVAKELAKGAKPCISESSSSGLSKDSLDVHSIASSLLLLCQETEGNVWDLDLDDVIIGDDSVSELGSDVSEFENDTLGCTDPRVVERVNEVTKVKPVQVGFQHFTVQFDKIIVREYDVILGDNPACRSGPSVSIGWEYEEFPALQLDDFEGIREGNRRTKRGMLMDRSYRVKLFKRLGYSESEIIDAVRHNKKIQQARLQTLSKGIVGFKLAAVSRRLHGLMARRNNLII